TTTAGKGATNTEHCVNNVDFLYNFQLGYWDDNKPLAEDSLFDDDCAVTNTSTSF
ncbi:hypothetical protein BgiMline_026303, partial [Biomphalaria glabrata]